MLYSINKKIFAAVLVLGFLVISNSVTPSYSFAATTTKPIPSVKVTGRAKFVLRGVVTAINANSLTLHVANTSKNAKLFDNKDETIAVGRKTKMTKNGHVIALKDVAKGDIVKVFGIFDKKSGAITLVRWIKVVPK